MNMTAKDQLTQDNKQLIEHRRKRRHWHEFEKMKIIEQYDKGELQSAPGKDNFVIDPKSKETLSVFLIESWKDAFRTLGLIKKAKQENRVTNIISAPTQQVSVDSGAMQTLLLNTLMENQELKKIVETMRRANGVVIRKNVSSENKQAKM